MSKNFFTALKIFIIKNIVFLFLLKEISREASSYYKNNVFKGLWAKKALILKQLPRYGYGVDGTVFGKRVCFGNRKGAPFCHAF